MASKGQRYRAMLKVHWLQGACQTLIDALKDDEPDFDIAEMNVVMGEVNSKVNDYLEASVGDGEEGG